MSTKNITLKPGETLVITCPPAAPAPKPPEPDGEGLSIFLTIDAVNFYRNEDGSYAQFKSDLDICNDGSGPAYDDPHHQSMTAYYSGGITGNKYLNADKDKYIVVPPQVRAKLPGVVMGCRGRVTNLKTMVVQEGVVGEIGPDYTSGECAYCLAKIINPSIGHNTGDKGRTYLYELWPGVNATDGDFTYKLQPAG